MDRIKLEQEIKEKEAKIKGLSGSSLYLVNKSLAKRKRQLQK
jgi:hypothetical protein